MGWASGDAAGLPPNAPQVKVITQAHTDSSGRLWVAYDTGFPFRRIAFLNHRHVARLRIQHQQIIFAAGKRQAIGMAADWQDGDQLADVNVINRDGVEPKLLTYSRELSLVTRPRDGRVPIR